MGMRIIFLQWYGSGPLFVVAVVALCLVSFEAFFQLVFSAV